jgi:flagellar FliL protein
MFLLSPRLYLLSLLLCLHIPLSVAEDASKSLYFAMEKPFVVNLSGSDALTYLQVNVQFKLKKADFREKLQKQLPAVENTLVMLLSDQTVASIKSVQGKQALRKTALKSVQQVCKKLIGDPTIDAVYFTGFIIQ